MLVIIIPYPEDVVADIECLFCWDRVADLCAEQHIEFVLNHALYMKAIPGAKETIGDKNSLF